MTSFFRKEHFFSFRFFCFVLFCSRFSVSLFFFHCLLLSFRPPVSLFVSLSRSLAVSLFQPESMSEVREALPLLREREGEREREHRVIEELFRSLSDLFSILYF